MPPELGRHIVVQGGTFITTQFSEVLKKIADCKAIRPDIAGIMVPSGAALIAKKNAMWKVPKPPCSPSKDQ